MNNESLADLVVDANDGQLEREPIKEGYTVKVTVSKNTIKAAAFTAASGLFVGWILVHKLNARGIAINTAQKVQDVAEQAEEAATRG